MKIDNPGASYTPDMQPARCHIKDKGPSYLFLQNITSKKVFGDVRKWWESYEKVVIKLWASCERVVGKLWEGCEKIVRKWWESCKKVVRKLWESCKKFVRKL